MNNTPPPGKQGYNLLSVKTALLNRRHILAVALLVLAASAVFANTFGNSFIWDDQNVIIDDPFIRDTGKLHFLFTREYWQRSSGSLGSGGRYRPLSMASFAVDHVLWGDNPSGYHLTNLVLHIMNVLLVYFLVFGLTDDRKDRLLPAPAFLAALFFAVFPVHVESVTWIKNRSDLLSTLFFLSSFLLFVEYLRRDGLAVRAYNLIASFSCFLLALLSKEIALTLPFFLFFYAAYFVPRAGLKRPLLGMLPFFALMAVFIVFKIAVPDVMPAPGGAEPAGFFQHMLAVLKTYGCYLLILLWPFNLNAERLFRIPASFFEPAVVLSVISLILILVFIIKTFRRRSLAGYSLLWILASLLPVSNLVFISGRPIAEQRLYLPSVGFCLLLSLAVYRLWSGPLGGLPAKASRITAASLAAALVVLYSAATLHRNTSWKDPLTFWSVTLEQSPASGRAYNNLAFAYSAMGEYERAIPLYKRSLELMPDYAQAYNNLGAAYGTQERYGEALALIREAIKTDPLNPGRYYNNLANVYLSLGDSRKALVLYRKALQVNPYDREAAANLSALYLRQARYDDAIKLNERMLEMDPSNADACHDLGVAYSFTGKVPRAVEMYVKALKISPERADTYRKLGVIYGAAGRNRESLEMLERSLELDPSSPETLNYLGVAYFAAGNAEKSAEFFKRALEKSPGYLEAYRNLTSVYHSAEKYDEAIGLHSAMLEISPQSADVYYNMGLAYFGKGEYSEAERCYRKVLEIDPAHIGAYNNLGAVLGSLGEMQEAAVVFKKALEISPGNTNAYFNLSLLYFREARYELAWEYYKKAEELGLDEPAYKKALEDALKKAGVEE